MIKSTTCIGVLNEAHVSSSFVCLICRFIKSLRSASFLWRAKSRWISRWASRLLRLTRCRMASHCVAHLGRSASHVFRFFPTRALQAEPRRKSSR